MLTALRPGPPASASAVAASLAQSLAPPEDWAPVPPWLLPEQQPSFRRLLAAIRRYQGAVLADPVGSGKTYVALAVAAAINRGPTACLVPATLVSQWQAIAAAVAVPVRVGSHEQVSRGKLPAGTRGLVIVDESHHFRNRHTKRYTNLAGWLVGRPALLVTATPIVNHPSDLGHQLWLAVRDNALAADGVVSYRSLLAGGCPAPALGQIVVERETGTALRPGKILKVSAPADEECAAASRWIGMLSRLRLSRNDSIAGLVRGVLLRSAASSPAALAGALHRYRRLLLHARDALRAGRALDRSELRRFTAQLGDQLVWWELLPSSGAPGDLELADLGELDGPIRAATAATQAADPKLARLRELLSDTKSTLVFTGSRDTVRYIRERLRDLQVAWCTGDRAGLGSATLPRADVLGWFRENPEPDPTPRHLVVTDLAAEGLDLQRAARVVHYDLPWTPMRLEQREGRAVRLGSRHRVVEVVRFAPPPEMERTLGLEATLARKAVLPAAAGLGQNGRHIWRWRSDLAGLLGGTEVMAGTAAVSSTRTGVLAGFALHHAGDQTCRLTAAVGWLEPGGTWTEAAEIVTERLLLAARSQTQPLSPEKLHQCLHPLAPVIRERLALIRARRWVAPEPAPAARHVAARLHASISAAARQRQGRRLLLLERALAFVAGGHTAGEAMLIDRLAASSAKEIEAALGRRAPAQVGRDDIEVRLTGLIVFDPDPSTVPG